MHKVIKGWFFLPAVLLLCLGIVESCSNYIPPPKVDKTELWKGISSSISLLTTSSEGAAGGNYALGSQATLIIAITTAQIVYADAAATQETVTTGVNNLNTAVNTYKSKVIPDIDPANLVAQYTFDQIGTTAYGAAVHDYSGNGRTASLGVGHSLWGKGVPTLGTDRYGTDARALHFDKGANIEIPYIADFNPPNLSISLWVKSDVNSPIVNNQYLVSLNRKRGYELRLDDSPKAIFSVNTAENPDNYITETFNSILTQAIWRHLVVTFGGGHMKFYVNGALVKDAPHDGTLLKQAIPINLILGQDLPTNRYSTDPSSPNYVNNGGYFIGTMDEVRIYKSVLTPDQITSIYTIEKP